MGPVGWGYSHQLISKLFPIREIPPLAELYKLVTGKIRIRKGHFLLWESRIKIWDLKIFEKSYKTINKNKLANNYKKLNKNNKMTKDKQSLFSTYCQGTIMG